ncbi:MAG: hypothetical protein ABW133_22340 [Polyangiaceae bacterium]
MLRRRSWFCFALALTSVACGNDIGDGPKGRTGGGGGSDGVGDSGSPGGTGGKGGGASTGGNGGATGGSGGATGGTGGATGGTGGATGGTGGATGGTGGTAGKGGAGGATGGTAGTAGKGGTGGAAGAGGSAGTGGTGGTPPPPPGDGGACTANVRVTEIDVGSAIFANEDEAALMPLAIAAIPGGGSRIAWMDKSSMVHVAQLDGGDQLTGAQFTLPAHDFGDIYADDAGGVLTITRDAQGAGTGNCGTLTNLCGTTLPSTATCYDMYLVRFDGTAETWAAKLTDPTPALPPYSTGPTGPSTTYIWSPYAHHSRIASDGSNYAAYFGAAISVSEKCTNGGGTNGTGINIHQGDRMKVVNGSGAVQTSGFNWGCSHSGYERVAWDPTAKKFVAICKTDNNNRIAIAPSYTTIFPVDLYYSNLANIVVGSAGGYWTATSNIRSGQPANASGMADVHLLHFSTGMADKDFVIAGDATLNNRAPHLAPYGATRVLAAWETSTANGDLSANDKNRKLYVQAFDAASGAAQGTPVNVPGVVGNRYQEFKGFPDGSVAYPAPGSANTKIKIVRALPCP